jgi:hypothetical protein
MTAGKITSDATRSRLLNAMYRRCSECGRQFFLGDEEDAAEWAYGHDCENVEEAGQ